MGRERENERECVCEKEREWGGREGLKVDSCRQTGVGVEGKNSQNKMIGKKAKTEIEM